MILRLMATGHVILQMEELNMNFNDSSHEQEPVGLTCGISIKGLHKKFKVYKLYLNILSILYDRLLVV